MFNKYDSMQNRELTNAERLADERMCIDVSVQYLEQLKRRLETASNDLTEEQLNTINKAVLSSANAVRNAAFLGYSWYEPLPVEMVEWNSKTNEQRTLDTIAQKITDTVFDIDPYNGADEEEVTEANLRDLSTLSGCYEIIDQLCDMLIELNDTI